MSMLKASSAVFLSLSGTGLWYSARTYIAMASGRLQMIYVGSALSQLRGSSVRNLSLTSPFTFTFALPTSLGRRLSYLGGHGVIFVVPLKPSSSEVKDKLRRDGDERP